MFEHFVIAQDRVYPGVVAELRAGRKQSHWMWFVFPQLAVLGRSDMARRYAIGSAAEARAYLRRARRPQPSSIFGSEPATTLSTRATRSS